MKRYETEEKLPSVDREGQNSVLQGMQNKTYNTSGELAPAYRTTEYNHN